MARKTKTLGPPPFNAAQFTPTQWATAEDKATFANDLVRFIEANFPDDGFTKALYNRVCNCRSHIAHFSREGFYHEWFRRPERRVDFVQRWSSHIGICGSPQYTFSDVERAVATYLTATNAIGRQVATAVRADESLATATIAQDQGDKVEFKVVRRSSNTGSFGHRGYFLLARDGTLFDVGKVDSNGDVWNLNDVVTVPKRTFGFGRPPEFDWSAVYVEVPRRLNVPPQALVDQMWETAK